LGWFGGGLRARDAWRPGAPCEAPDNIAGGGLAPGWRWRKGGPEPIDVTPIFSVIVPYRNEARHISACVKALQQQSIGASRYELLFVDNGSTDGTSSAIREAPGVAVIREGKPGSYAARNAALRTARGQFFAFTDADCVPQPDWLERAGEAMRASGAAVVVGRRVCPEGSSLGVQLLQEYEDAKAEFVLNHLPSRFAFGMCSNMIVRADVFRRVGMFDDWARAADTAYLHRVTQSDPAYRVVYWPSMCVTHLEIRTTGQALSRIFVYGGSNTRAARQYGYSPLGLRHRWELWRQCRSNMRRSRRHRLLLFCLLVSGGLLYKCGELKGRLGW
jgi:glycosyltransferase involved in cell wall biosynthesis